MRRLSLALATVLFTLLVFVSGCTEGPATLPEINTSLGYETGTTTLKTVEWRNISDIMTDVCTDTGRCVVLGCTNKSGFFLWRWLGLSETTLKGERCDFVTCSGCNDVGEDCIENCLDDYGGVPINFMVGEGSSFGEAIYAAWYLNYSFVSAVKWLEPDNETVFILPKRERAETALYFNKIPVYVVPPIQPHVLRDDYIGRVESLAFIMSANDTVGWDEPVGPVMVVLRVPDNPSSDDVWTVRRAAEHIKRICPTCLVGVMPPLIPYNQSWLNSTDKEVSDYVLNVTVYGRDPNTHNLPEPCADWNGIMNETNCVDFIADGVILNNLKECDGYYAAKEVMIRSRMRVKTFHKPTFLLFVGGRPGNNTFNTCNWTDQTIAHTYNIFYHDIPNLVASGVFGMHVCNFNEPYNNNPYCNVSRFGVFNQYFGAVDGSDPTQIRRLQATAWLVNHYGYYTEKLLKTGSTEIPISMVSEVVFPWNGFGLSCYLHTGLGASVIDVFYGSVKPPAEATYSYNDSILYDVLLPMGNDFIASHKWNGTFMPCDVHDDPPSNLKNAMSGSPAQSIGARHNDYIDNYIAPERGSGIAVCSLTLRDYDDKGNYLVVESDRYDVDPFLMYAIHNITGDDYPEIGRKMASLYHEAFSYVLDNAENDGLDFEDIGLDKRKDRDWVINYLAVYGYVNGELEMEDLIDEFFSRRGAGVHDGCGSPDKIERFLFNTDCRNVVRSYSGTAGDVFEDPDKIIALYYAYVDKHGEGCYSYYSDDPDSGYYKQCFEERDDAVD